MHIQGNCKNINHFISAILFGCLLLISGCGYYEMQQSGRAAQDTYVLMLGFSKDEVRRCAGEPSEILSDANGGETWKYIYPWSKYNYTDVYYEGYVFIQFDEDEVADVTSSANRERDSIGIPLTGNQISSLSYPVIKDCVG